ncbi:hypothetical protein C8Q74DRAFT_1224415 [Fomes fomentarius]|nr:hypothetical protein C8Q74DRAFT_1224415 [Fomes fomentarius]
MVQQLMVMKQASRSVRSMDNEKAILIFVIGMDGSRRSRRLPYPNRTWLRSPSLPSKDDTRAGSFVTPSTHCSRAASYR